MKQLITYLLLSLLVIGCSKHADSDEPDNGGGTGVLPVDTVPTGCIAFRLAVTNNSATLKSSTSRAMLSDTAVSIPSTGYFHVIAIKYKEKNPDGSYKAGDAVTYIEGDRLLLDAKIGSLYTYFQNGEANQRYYWPYDRDNDEYYKSDFFAYYITNPEVVSPDYGVRELGWTILGSIDRQSDLLYDSNPDNVAGLSRKADQDAVPVKLKMKHALAQVRFKIASTTSTAIKLKQIEFSDYKKGVFSLEQYCFNSVFSEEIFYLSPRSGEVVAPKALGKTSECASENYISTSLFPQTWENKSIGVVLESGAFQEGFSMTVCKTAKELKAGYIYTFNIVYDGNTIEIAEPEVVDWQQEDGNELD